MCSDHLPRSAPRTNLRVSNYSGIQVRSIRFDNAMEFGQSDHFQSWVKAKGAVLCPAVNYNHTLNSKSECYVRITKEHLRCMLLSSNAPRRLWPFALQHFCRIFGWWSKANGIAPWKPSARNVKSQLTWIKISVTCFRQLLHWASSSRK